MIACHEHICAQNTTRNEVYNEFSIGNHTWPPLLTLVGKTETGHFEHSERINYCPYCGKDLMMGGREIG